MESELSPVDKQAMMSSFLEIAIGQTTAIAEQFLEATGWKFEEAVKLFYSQPAHNVASCDNPNTAGEREEDEVCPPFCDGSPMLHGVSRIGNPSHGSNFEDKTRHPDVCKSDQGSASTTDNSRQNIASAYSPFHLMYNGCFEKAKGAAAAQNKWLLVNLQSTRFSKHMFNKETWEHETLSQTVKENFIFWRSYDCTPEGRKVCTFYKLDSVPVLLVIDPNTGKKMQSWYGMIQPESFLEDLFTFTKGGPKDHHLTSRKRPRISSVTPLHKIKVARNYISNENEEVSMESNKELNGVISEDKEASNKELNGATSTDKEEETCSIKKPTYPPLPEEPEADGNLLCNVRVRLPDGRRVQRNFLLSDPIQLLWSFCDFQLEEDKTRSFCFTYAVPGASKSLQYDSKLTFKEAGIANCMISVTWK